MEGNAQDFALIQGFLHVICGKRVEANGAISADSVREDVEDEREFWFSVGTRVRIARASFKLSESFCQCETQTRSQWNMNGAKKNQTAARALYLAEEANRRAALRSLVQPLPHDAPREAREARDDQLRLRLDPVDPVYATWQQAVTRCKRSLYEALLEDPRNEDGEEVGVWMTGCAQIMERFPVEIEMA